MKILGQPLAFVVVAALLWLLAIAHPIAWLQRRDAVVGTQRRLDPASSYVALLEASDPLRETLRDQELIGYASEAEIDTRIGGVTQARYYLSQFALAPVLLELDSTTGRGGVEPEYVLANFDLPDQLKRYLIEDGRTAVVTLNPNVALTRARER